MFYVQPCIVYLEVIHASELLHPTALKRCATNPAGCFGKVRAQPLGFALHEPYLALRFWLGSLNESATPGLRWVYTPGCVKVFRAFGLPNVSEVFGHIKTNTARAQYRNRFTGHFFAFEQIVVAHHFGVIHAGYFRHARFNAGGNHNVVKAGQVFSARRHAQAHIHPVARKLVTEIAKRLRKLFLAGNLPRQIELAANLGGFFKKRYIVAACGQGGRTSQPCWSCTHDHDLTNLDGRCEHPICFTARAGIHQTRCRFALEDVIQTGLIASDAGVDGRSLARLGLVRKLWVGEQGPGERNHVRLATSQNAFGYLWRIDAVHSNQYARGSRRHFGSWRGGHGFARPALARRPEFANKAEAGEAAAINTCIACNQACLDHIFEGKTASCLVNPRAGREADWVLTPAVKVRKVVVVGAGPAGLACATTLAARGHDVTLFEEAAEIGGQFNLARKIPGKEEFSETLRYFRHQLARHWVNVRLGVAARAEDLAGFDDVVIATGVKPRVPEIPGVDHPKVVRYDDLLKGKKVAGKTVAILGAGGIGFDVAEYLTHVGQAESAEDFYAAWGIDPTQAGRGGLVEASEPKPERQVWLMQRKAERLGANLAKTTGWIRRATLKRRGVQQLAGVNYLKIDDAGLHIEHEGKALCLPVDTIVLCTGQLSRRALYDELAALGVSAHIIGGAEVAGELDAKRAIESGTRLGMAL